MHSCECRKTGELPGHGMDNVLGLTGLEQVALSTSHTFSRSTSFRRTCFTSTPRIDVFAARTAAVDVLPLGTAGGGLEQPLLLLGRERPADGPAVGLAQHRDVVLQTAPVAVALQELAQRTKVHVDRAIADSIEVRLAWKPSIVSRVMVDSSRSPRRSCTIANRSSSKATVRSRFAVAASR